MSRTIGRRNEHHSLRPIFLLIAALLTLLAVVATLDERTIGLLVRENGIIETASALGYFGCLAALAFLGGLRFVLLRIPYVAVIILFLGLRELDADKRFTTMGIFKSQFYLSPEVPWSEKIVAVLFLGVLVWSLIELADRHGRRFISDLTSLRPVAACVALAALFAVAAKSLDGLARKLDGFGLAIGERGVLVAQVAEEVLELGIPLLLILAACTYFGVLNKAGAGNDHP